MRPTYKVTELLGDGIGAELSRAVHALAEALPIRLDFEPVDLSLESRRSRGKAVYDAAVASIGANKVALKYPTVTAEESPNAVLRRRLDLSVIHRPVYTIPGVPTNFRRELDLELAFDDDRPEALLPLPRELPPPLALIPPPPRFAI